MSLDRVLAKEIKNACGTTRDEKFAFAKQVEAVAKELSTTNARQVFDSLFHSHSRAAIAVCVASTIQARRDRLSHFSVCWADDVMKCYTNRILTLNRFHIDDNLHPSRIEEYAGSFIRLTTE